MKQVFGWGAAVALGLAACASAHAETLRLGAAVAPARAVEFDVIMPLRDEAGLENLLKVQQDPASHYYHQWLTPAAFAAKFGPDAAVMKRAAQAFAAKGLAVTIQSRSLHISGTADAVGRVLGTTLVDGTSVSGHHYLVAAKSPSLPQAAADAGAFILDFNREVFEGHVDSKQVPGVKLAATGPYNRDGYTGGYFFDDQKQAYNYPSYQTMVSVNGTPTRLDGTGTTIGVLMSSDIYDIDIPVMFEREKFTKITGQPAPRIYAKVKVNGGSTVASDALAEASIDTQEEIGSAPGAHVVLYEIPTLSNVNILAGYLAIDEANTASVISSSFGGCELTFTPAYAGKSYPNELEALQLSHQLFEQGNAQGISFFASSGDESGLECPSLSYFQGGPGTFIPSVSWPADDPNVTAVGGGNLVTNSTPYSLNSAYIEENGYNDPEIPYDAYGFGQTVSGGAFGAGGGFSALYAQPSYQTKIDTGTTSARAMPDIGMHVGGCPGGIAILPCDGGDTAIDGSGNDLRSYFFTAIDGAFYGYIGTSLSSPEIAGATALLVETHGRMGNMNPYIYAAAAKQAADGGISTAATTLFHTGIPGYNGVEADGALGTTYNYTYGVGSPVVFRYVGASSAATAGNPQTPSNP